MEQTVSRRDVTILHQLRFALECHSGTSTRLRRPCDRKSHRHNAAQRYTSRYICHFACIYSEPNEGGKHIVPRLEMLGLLHGGR